MNQIFNFLYNNEIKTFGLYGYAGTGKTTVTVKLVNYLIYKGYIKSVALTAPTNKAVNIMKSKFKNDINILLEKLSNTTDDIKNMHLNNQLDVLEESGYKIHFLTIHKLLNFKNDFDVDGSMIFVKGKKTNIYEYDLVIVDECSMISFQIIANIFEDIRNQVISLGKDENVIKKVPKVLFIGDPAQLPPVNEKVSIIFSKNKNDFSFDMYKKMQPENNNIINAKEHNNNMLKLFDELRNDIMKNKSITMTKIVRSNDMAVVNVCNEVRSWVIGQITIPKIGQYKGPNVKLYKYDEKIQKTQTTWFKTCLEYFKSDDNSRVSNIILAWTNKQCNDYNTMVRSKLFNKTQLNQFEKGDILMLKDFYNMKETEVKDKDDQKKFYTSEQIKVMELEEVTKVCPPFAETLPLKLAKMKNFKFIEDKYKQTMKNINKSTSRKYNTWKLYVHKLMEVLAKDSVPELYTIYVLKNDSFNTLEKDREHASAKIKELRNYFRGHFKDQINRIDKDIIKMLWKEWNSRFWEPFANVNVCFAETCHASQSSTFYNVFIDTHDILYNKNEDEAKRCIYTAMTRTSNELHILI